MKRPNLADSSNRALFDSECDVVKAHSEGRRIGWVMMESPGRCALTVGPWAKVPFSHEIYTLPSDHGLIDGDFVELEVGTKKTRVLEVDRKTGLARRFEYECTVEKVTRLNLKIKEPLMRREDFIAATCDGWINAELDSLDTVLGMLLVSCPPRTVYVGGLGSETAHERGLKGPRRAVAKTIVSCLPADFLAVNPNYVFKLVEDGYDQADLSRLMRRASTSEVSFLGGLSVRPVSATQSITPMNLPLVLRDSEAVASPREKEFEFYDFLLKVHLAQPIIGNDAVPEVSRFIREMRTQYLPAFNEYNILVDPHSVTRVALALARMDLASKVKPEHVQEAWRLCEPLYKDYVAHLEDVFDVEEVSVARMRARKKLLKEGTEKRRFVWYEDLTKDESTVYEAILDGFGSSREDTEIKCLLEFLEPTIPAEKVAKAIRSLNEKGRVLISSSRTQIRAVK